MNSHFRAMHGGGFKAQRCGLLSSPKWCAVGEFYILISSFMKLIAPKVDHLSMCGDSRIAALISLFPWCMINEWAPIIIHWTFILLVSWWVVLCGPSCGWECDCDCMEKCAAAWRRLLPCLENHAASPCVTTYT